MLDPKFAHKLFSDKEQEDDDEADQKSIRKSIKKHKNLDAHKLFNGKTKDQKKLKKMNKAKQNRIAQMTAGAG